MLLTVPAVSSINVIGAITTNANSISWTVTFSAAVTGVDPTDFTLIQTGTAGATLTQVKGSGSAYTVTVSGITGTGTLGLNLVDNDSIQNSGNTPLGGVGTGNGNFTGQVATVDHTFPSVVSINRSNPSSAATNAASVSYTATFSEPVTGVDSSDFSLALTGAMNTTSMTVSPVTSSVYTVTIGGISGNGTLVLSLVDDGSIRDLAGNPLTKSNPLVSFANPATLDLGVAPQALTQGDVNGDGKLDLIVGSGSNVIVLLGNGNGTFQAGQTFATGSAPDSVALGDVNGDGKTDLAVANDNNDSLSVLLGNGDGTFQTQQTLVTGSHPHSIAVGDVNGDGRVDLVVTNTGLDCVGVLLGNGNGTFQAQQTFATGSQPWSIAMADLNRDGKPDLVATNNSSSTVSILYGNGDGTFQAQQTYATQAFPRWVTVSDLNGDGKPDIAVANYGSDTVSVFLGNGNGTFVAQQTLSTGSAPLSVTVADINEDGIPDLVTADRTGGDVSVILDYGNGTFQAVKTYATGTYSFLVVPGDFNGDGKPDLVVANYGSNSSTVLLSNGNGNFTGQGYNFPPSVVSLNRLTPASGLTNSNRVSFTATFSEPVTGVDPTDFSVVTTGTVGDTLIQVSPVSGSNGTTYTVIVSGITGSGTLGVNLVDDDSITDSSHLPLGGTGIANGNFVGQVDTIDTVAPLVQSLDRVSPASAVTSSSSVSFTVTFDEPVTGVDPTDFAVVTTGSVVSSLKQVTAISASVYTVTIGGISGTGTLGLNLVDNGTIHDLAGNHLTGPSFTTTFFNQPALASGTKPKSTAAGDLNGDGIPDLVVANYGSNTVSVLLGNANGTFSAQQTIATGTAPDSVALSDVNGDGKADIVVANDQSNSVSVLLGNGNGTFASQQTFAVGIRPYSVATGDVNGDGIRDLIVANYGDSNVGVLLGNGNGTFQLQVTFATGSHSEFVTVADVNSDGRPDLVVANPASSNAGILVGNGDGSFQSEQTFTTATAANSLTVGDLNGDGKPDLIAPNYTGNCVSILSGNGDGTYQSPQTFATGAGSNFAKLSDLNGDGIPDLAVVNATDATLSILIGNGDGTFAAQQTFATGAKPESLVVADFNGDGIPDLAVGNYVGNTLSLLFGKRDGAFTGQTFTIDHVAPFVQTINRTNPSTATTSATTISFTVTFSEPVTGVDTSDFTLITTGTIGTALTQVVAIDAATYTVTISGITGTGTLGLNLVDNSSIRDLAGNPLVNPNASVSFGNQATFATGANPKSIAIGDLNGDGNLDVVAANFGGNSLSILLGNGNGTFATQQTLSTGTNPRAVKLSDLNADGNLDLIVTDSGDNKVSVFLGNGNGTFLPRQTFATGATPFAVVAADVNGDGVPDLIVTNFTNSSVSVLLGNGDGTFAAQQLFATGGNPQSVTVGDANGDGVSDIAVANNGSNSVSLLLGNGNGTFQTQRVFATGTHPASVALKDVSGDGKADLIVANINSNTVSVLLGNGNGTFVAQKTFATGTSPFSVAVNDLNGDGKPDLVVANNSGTSLSVLMGNGNGTFQVQKTFTAGSAPIAVIVNDVNADGRPDLIVANTNSSNVSVLLANGNGSFTGQVYTIISAPVVTTPTITSISNTSATLGANVTSAGGGTITERGIVYSLTGTNSNPQIGGTGVTKLTSPGTTGVFTLTVVSLTTGAVYSFAAYATNSVGTTYTPITTFTPGPVTVTSVSNAGNAVTSGSMLTGAVTGLSVAFSENMNAVPSGANSVINPANWVLLRYGVDVSYLISGITFNLDPGTLQYVAAVAFSSPLVQGGYLLMARQTLQDVSGRRLDGDGDGAAGGDFTRNFYVAATIGNSTDVAPLLYGLDFATAQSVVAPLSTPIAPSLMVFDVDSTNWTGATVQFSSNYVNGQDTLSFANTKKIFGLWSPATGTLTLSGTDTISNYRAALQSVTYHNSSTTTPNTSLTRTIQIQANDGLMPSNVVSLSLNVMPSSTPAVLAGLPATAAVYTENATGLAIGSALTITDPDSNYLSSATVSFTNWQAEDRVTFNNIFALQHTLTQNLTLHTATFSITGKATVFQYQTLLRSVVYSDVTNNPITTSRVASFAVNDGLANSNAASRTINVTSVNDAPIISGIESTPLIAPAKVVPQEISGTLLVGDADSLNFTKAVVKITAGYEQTASGKDLLTFVNQSGITGSWNPTTGTLTLTGTSSGSNYRAALRSITFSTTGLSTNNRTVTITVTDDSGTGTATSLPMTRTIMVPASDIAPGLAGIPSTSLSYVRGARGLIIAPSAVVIAPDCINMAGATVQISGSYQSGLDQLSATPVSGITTSFNAATGLLTLSGNSSLANYQTVLRTVNFLTTSSANTNTRTLTFTLNDGLLLSGPVTRTVAIK